MSEEIEAIKVEQRHRVAAANALGYKDWDDATDYRNTGGQLKALGNMVQAFARFERDHLATLPNEADVTQGDMDAAREFVGRHFDKVIHRYITQAFAAYRQQSQAAVTGLVEALEWYATGRQSDRGMRARTALADYRGTATSPSKGPPLPSDG